LKQPKCVSVLQGLYTNSVQVENQDQEIGPPGNYDSSLVYMVGLNMTGLSTGTHRTGAPGLQGSSCDGFRFGFESEFIVACADTYQPLWHDSLTFSELELVLESVPLDGLPTLCGLENKSPGNRLLPYYVEGYDVYGSDGAFTDVLPKGLELRTPISGSPEEALENARILKERLAAAMARENLAIVSLSHHPTGTAFSGERQNRDVQRWKWAQEAMFNFALHANLSLPSALRATLDIEDLHRKVNYYAPALTAFSLNAPIYDGVLWSQDGRIGKSKRIHRRSKVAPTFVFHPEQDYRMEFKAFDVTNDDESMLAYLLLWLALVLDDSLHGRTDDPDRREKMNTVSLVGLSDEEIYKRANLVLESAYLELPRWGFRTNALTVLADRLDDRRCPADDVIDWMQDGLSLSEVLRELSAGSADDVFMSEQLQQTMRGAVR